MRHQISSRLPCREVVHADVRRAPARRHVSHERHHRDPYRAEPLHGLHDRRMIGGLEDDSVRAAADDRVQSVCRCVRVAGLPQGGPHPEHRRPQRPQLDLQSIATLGCEPVRCLHDQVQNDRLAGQLNLRPLSVELSDRPLHLRHRLRPHAWATVEHSIYRGVAQTRLSGNVYNAVLPTHLQATKPGVASVRTGRTRRSTSSPGTGDRRARALVRWRRMPSATW